jgi:DNA-binding response OmpR family regulator
MSRHILIVDDDTLLCAGVVFNLQRVGYTTAIAATAEEALESVRQRQPDVILLDIGLPGMDGLQALRAFQQEASIPVIFVTARRRELDEIVGLELGADDYITKPFDMDVLLARIKAVLRRVSLHPEALSQPITVGDLQIDPDSHVARVGEGTLELSPKEFAMLLVLAQEAGHVVSVDELIKRVWGTEWVGEIQTVYVHIHWLREKIERDPTQPRRLVTIKGTGYKLVPITE